MVWKPEGKRHIAMRRRRREDNIKIRLIPMGVALWTGWFWLRIWTSGVFQHEFHKCVGFNSWPAEWLL